MHTDHAYYSVSLDILILWWPHKGHNTTTYIIKNWTSRQSIQLFIKSGLSWVIESSALQAVQTSVYLLIHLLICVYCSRADLILVETFALLFSILSLTRLLRPRCVEWLACEGRTKRASEWEYDRWRQSSWRCYNSMQEHATWWCAVVNELCLIGQLCWWAGPRWGSAPHLSAPRGQKAWKICHRCLAAECTARSNMIKCSLS